MRADILLIAQNTKQLAKHPRALYVNPSNKVYLLFHYWAILPYKGNTKERAKCTTLLHCRTGQKYGLTGGATKWPN